MYVCKWTHLNNLSSEHKERLPLSEDGLSHHLTVMKGLRCEPAVQQPTGIQELIHLNATFIRFNQTWPQMRKIWLWMGATWKDGIEKPLPPSVWQYSYSSVHWMAGLVAKYLKDCLKWRSIGGHLALASCLHQSTDNMHDNQTDNWCREALAAHLWLLPRSTSLSDFCVNTPKGALAVR